jgi:predicted lipid carrier protein YhbT
MADPTADFFSALGQRGHEPLLEKISGTVRADVAIGDQPERWLVTIDRGDISVSRSDAKADCVIQGDKETFDRLCSGEANAMAMVLRGALVIDGNVELLALFQRLFPGPPGQREQPITAGYARRHA